MSFTVGSNTALTGRFAPFAKRPDKEGGFTMSMRSTSPQLPRRQFLRKAVTAAGAAAAMPAFQGLHLLAAAGRPSAPKGNGGYGPLFPTPDLRDGVNRISLPEGFSYRSFSVAGSMMSDGHRVPLAHDLDEANPEDAEQEPLPRPVAGLVQPAREPYEEASMEAEDAAEPEMSAAPHTDPKRRHR